MFIYADNGYPFDANLSLQLLGENNQVIKSLAVENNIASAPVDANLKVTAKKGSVLTIPLSKADIDALYSAKKMVFKIAFTTTAQPQFIKIYDGYSIDIKVIGDFAYQIN